LYSETTATRWSGLKNKVMMYRFRIRANGEAKLFEEKGSTKNLFIHVSISEIFCSDDKINEALDFLYSKNLKVYSDRTKRVYGTLNGALKMVQTNYVKNS